MDGSMTLALQSLIYIEFACFLLRSRKPAHSAGYWIGATVLTVIFCGDDFGNMLSFMVVCAACLFVPQVRRSRTGKLIALQLVVSLVCMAVCFLAPGNSVRMEVLTGKSMPVSVILAIYHGFKLLDNGWMWQESVYFSSSVSCWHRC